MLQKLDDSTTSLRFSPHKIQRSWIHILKTENIPLKVSVLQVAAQFSLGPVRVLLEVDRFRPDRAVGQAY